ncbi:MAG: hypothetical protein LBJ23_10715 [Tannerella sp.]|jgi:hypothetical protein|nr:hypothetical protein [Tannerella sp.]
MKPFFSKNIANRKTPGIRYPECDCFGEWQEHPNIEHDMEIVNTADEHDPEADDISDPDDPFFGHYNMFF